MEDSSWDPELDLFKSYSGPFSWDKSHKVIWCLAVFLFPIVGAIVYFIFSNRKAHNTYEPLP